MTKEQVEEKLRKLVTMQVGIEGFPKDANLVFDLNFDDLDYVEYVMDIEEEFDIELSDEEFNEVNMKTFEDTLNVVCAKVVGGET
jgi:acyl carrier protein